MSAAPVPDNEAERLEALVSAEILDTPSEEGFDRIVRMAKAVSGAPIALVSLVDTDRQWFKACIGLDATETHRDVAFCAHAILQNDVFWIEDARADARFSDSALVVGPPHIRFYGGAPITLGNGLRVGTVCVIDTAPRAFDPVMAEALTELAGIASDLFFARTSLLRSREHELLLEAHKLQLEAQQAQLQAQSVQLAASEHHYRSVVTAMSEGVVVQNQSGAILACNPAAEAILGLTADQMMGRTSMDPAWRAIKYDGTDFPGEEHPAMVCLRTGVPQRDVVMGVVLPSGERRWINIHSEPVWLGDTHRPDQVVTTFADITEQRLLNAQLTLERDKADMANRAKSQFLANMSHEIRTPLNGVVGVASALAKTDLNVHQTEMVDIILSSGVLLERLLHDVLDLSKIEAGAMTVEIAPFDLVRDMQAMAQLFKARADDKGLSFDLGLDDAARGHFLGDTVRVRQIVSNLLSNAIKFTSHGGVRLDIWVDETTEPGMPAMITLQVCDTGIGFDDAAADWLFKPFVQADSSITRTYGGTGLGLSIVHGLVKQMDGAVKVSSTPGVGSTFCIYLPMMRADAATVAETRGEDVWDVHAALMGKRVLVAEDHAVNQKVLELILNPLGVDLVMVNNGLEAVQACATEDFDLVLMDMQMPVMDGLLATTAILANAKSTGRTEVPIAMLSANALDEHRAQSKAAGACVHITKPIRPETLLMGMIEAMSGPRVDVAQHHCA